MLDSFMVFHISYCLSTKWILTTYFFNKYYLYYTNVYIITLGCYIHIITFTLGCCIRNKNGLANIFGIK